MSAMCNYRSSILVNTIIILSHFRNRVLLSNNASTNPTTPPPTNSIINNDADNPPEYTEATTSFIERDSNESITSDTDPLVTPPPPYVP